MTGTPPEFLEHISRWAEAPVPVALDGALFDNLPRMLAEAGFKALSLFIELNDPAIRRVSPYFVHVPHARLREFLTLPNITKGGVFWNAPDCEQMAFYRHLRSLTQTRIPARKETIASGGKLTRMVVFRHFDPGMVAITLPVMTLAQRARMLGPAQSLLIDAPEGVLEAKRRRDWPEPEKGALTFSREQMRLVRKGLNRRNHYPSTIKFLRKFAVKFANDKTDEQLNAIIADAEDHATEWRLLTPAGLTSLSFLACITEGDVYRDDNLRDEVTRPGPKDAAENRLMDKVYKTIDELQSRGYYR